MRLCALTVAVTTCLGLFCASRKSNSDVRSVEWREPMFVLCHLLPPHWSHRHCRAISMDEWHKCMLNSFYPPHLSVNSSERKTLAIFQKFDYRFWGRNTSSVFGPLSSKLDWINLFIMFPNTLKVASRVTKIYCGPNQVMHFPGLWMVLCASNENCYHWLRLRNVLWC